MSIQQQIKKLAAGIGLTIEDDQLLGVNIHRLRSEGMRYLGHIMMGIALAVIVFPLYWMLSTSLRPRAENFQRLKPILNNGLSLEHYEAIIFGGSTNALQYYWNSILIALGVVVVATTIATLGGYGLSRLDIPHRRLFARGILFGYMFPPVLLAIPMFIYWRQIGLVNTYGGVILAEAAGTLPFSLWLMWKFFQSVPESYEESAQVAGASRFRGFIDVALPMAKPGIIAVAIFAYANSWDQFTIPKIILTDQGLWPLTVGLQTFTQQYNVYWGQIMAASFLTIIPSFIFVFFLQKYMLQGYRI